MSALGRRIRAAEYSVELASAAVCEAECFGEDSLCSRFYHESQFAAVAPYDRELTEGLIRMLVERGTRYVFLGRANGVPVGMLMVDFARHFTAVDLAHLFVIYVEPEWRASPLGRMLLLAALALAKAKGVPAFYAGMTSGISTENTHRLGNMLRRYGFTDVGLNLRKVMEA